MRNNGNSERAKLKGYLFEIAISKLLSDNDFSEITSGAPNRIKIERDGFVEFKGRGGWHQIDCPFEYKLNIPFTNPIRLLSEIKCHNKKIQKEHIRAYVGIIKDIQENYFVNDINDTYQDRFNEIGAFFSASGFSAEAEMMAFAHNIKTISYENVELIEAITDSVKSLEEQYLDTRYCIAQGQQVEFLRWFKRVLIDNEPIYDYDREIYNLPDGIDEEISNLRESIYSIRSHFFTNTSAGGFIHFVSGSRFPDELFRETDIQNIEIHFSQIDSRRKNFWLSFSEDHEERRFYFKPPSNLNMAAFWGGRTVLNEKERIFKELTLMKRINGISRTLTLRINPRWLDSLFAYA